MKDAGSRQGISTSCQVPLKLSQPSAVKDNQVLCAQAGIVKPLPSCFPGARPLDKGSLAEPFPACSHGDPLGMPGMLLCIRILLQT